MPASHQNSQIPLIVIAGATASGKSELAVQVAKALDGEVINTDALQFYQGMDIGTAKITEAERQGIKHHLFDFLQVTQEASVAEFQQLARNKVAEIRGRSRVPVAVGGSGLYLRALTDKIAFPPSDPPVRAKLEAWVKENSVAVAYAKLQQVDLDAAQKINPADERRIIRALEVQEITGKPFSAYLPKYEFWDSNIIYTAIARSREALHQRVELRVTKMLEAGLLDEVRGLQAAGLEQGKTARQAIGYAQALAYLAGELDYVQMQEQIVVGTRKLVRKQDTWFKRDPRFTWLDGENPAAALQEILSQYEQLQRETKNAQ